MKKLLLSLGLILAITLSANAQPGRRVHRHYGHVPAPRPRYEAPLPFYDDIGQLRFHVAGELGINDLSGIFFHEYPYHFSAGGMLEVQTGRLLSLGLGAEYYATHNISFNNMQSMDRPYFTSLPVYANLRLSTPGNVAKFFVEVRAGYAFPLNYVTIGNSYGAYETRGFFTGGGIGFGCYGNNISIGMNAIDVNKYNGPVLHDGQGVGHGGRNIITDFYLRYSYAIPLN